ncbi:MAG: TonB-dependent receptor [Balneolaceae bacterium]
MQSTIRNFFQKVLISFLLNFLLFSWLSAQGIPNDTLEVNLDEIQIEAAYSSITIGKAPFSLSYKVRGAKEITAAPAATLDELTYTLPGVFISNRENYALGERLTVRGLGWRSQFGVRGVQVVLDDIPLTVADGQTIMSMIDPAMVRRIELLRGPSATFWGNSSGGVIHLGTIPERETPSLQYRGYGGSYSTLKQEIKLNHEFGSTRFYGYASYFDTEGYRDYSAATLFRSSLGIEHEISNRGRIRGTINYTSMPEAQHPGSLTLMQSEESPKLARDLFVNGQAGKTFDQAMAAVSYLHDFDTGIFNVIAHGTYRDLANPLPFGYISLERQAGGVRATHQFQELPFELSIGGELKIQQDDRLETNIENGNPGSEVDVMQVETVTNQAIFTRIGIPLSEQFILSAGLRADRLRFETDDDLSQNQEGNRDFFALNPSLGFSYQMNNNSRIFANYSTSFESPTTTELVNRPEGGNGFNQNLNPERAVSIESGVSGNTGNRKFQYDLTLFAMQVKDLLIPFQTDPDGPVFFRNEGSTTHYGLETSAGVQLNNRLNWNLMANFLQAEFDDGDFEGNKIPGVTPFRFGSTIQYENVLQAISLHTEWLGSYYADSANSESNPAYVLFHLRWALDLENLFTEGSIKPFVAVNNIFNTRYNSSVAINAAGNRFFEPGSDRNFRIGLQIDLF